MVITGQIQHLALQSFSLMNHEGSVKCIHNIYITVVKPVCSCGIEQSGELYKYLQILLTSWRQSSGRTLGWVEAGTHDKQGKREKLALFTVTYRSFHGHPLSSERYTQKVGSGSGSQTARDDLLEPKKNILLQTGKILSSERT